MPIENRLVRRMKRLLLPNGGMLLGSGTHKSIKVLPQLSNKARFLALFSMLRTVEPAFRREALRFLRKMLASRPEYLQQSLDYLVPGYHYFRFTRDSIRPEYKDILLKLPLMNVVAEPELSKPALVRITTA
jgi:hypothetical protein